MKIALRLAVVVIMFAACFSNESLGTEFTGPAGDGWHTWQVTAANGDVLHIYTLLRFGEPVEFRVRSKSVCVDDFEVDAVDLGNVDVDQSVDWLQQYIEPRAELSSAAIMAISLHSGDRPIAVLANIVTTGTDRRIREEALFWLGQSDSDEAFAVLDRLLSGAM
jgi:hypothetical protein